MGRGGKKKKQSPLKCFHFKLELNALQRPWLIVTGRCPAGDVATWASQMCIPWKGKVEVPAPTLTKQHPNPRAIFQHGHAAGFQMPFLSGVCTAFCFVDEGMSVC